MKRATAVLALLLFAASAAHAGRLFKVERRPSRDGHVTGIIKLKVFSNMRKTEKAEDKAEREMSHLCGGDYTLVSSNDKDKGRKEEILEFRCNPDSGK